MMHLKRNIEQIDVLLIERVVNSMINNEKRVIVGHNHLFMRIGCRLTYSILSETRFYIALKRIFC